MKERMIEMSKWTDVRDNVIDTLHVEDVTEDVKQHVTATLLMQGGVYVVKLVLSKTVAQTAAA